MAILSFALTADKFLSGEKTVTRRDWSEKHLEMWQRMWDTDRLEHDAWDNLPRAGGKKIGRFELTDRPYLEKLIEMPISDLEREGGMCETLEDFYQLIGKEPLDSVVVIRFRRI